MACQLVLLTLWALARALSQPDLCEYETNKIKDLLQASCVGKGLTQVPPGLDHNTGILLLGSNSLARVSTATFRQLRNLTDLDLSHNGMEDLEAASPLPTLQELDLSHNTLRNLPALQGFPSLTRLALGHNALSGLPEGGFRALRQLVDLELQGNQLSSLPEGAFEGLDALKDLDLSDNHLTVLPPELLAELLALETLRLERNQLQSLPEGFFPEGQLFAYVYLAENPWLCDCALEYLRNWILENTFSVYTRVQKAEKEITENEPKNVTCREPPEELGQPVMEFQSNCQPEGSRGSLGDEEISEPQTSPSGPNTSPEALATPPSPATVPAPFTQPEPAAPARPTPSLPTSRATPLARSTAPATPSASPTAMGSQATAAPTTTAAQTAAAPSTSGLSPVPATAVPTTTAAQTAAAASTSGLSPVPTTAVPTTTAAQTAAAASTSGFSPVPTTAVPTTTAAQTAAAASTLGLSLVPTTASPGTGEPATTPPTPAQAMSTAQATPAPSGTTALLLPATTHPGLTAHLQGPAPPAYCQCPIMPSVALGLSRQRPPPASWGAWLAVHCCPLRLALYVACLVLVLLPMLAVLCWWGWTGTWHSEATQGALGAQLVRHQQLQQVACERCQVPGEGRQPLPRPRLYRVCKKLEIGPLRYVTWLLISLPGPSGQWPWERMGSFPSYGLDRGKDDLRALRVRYASSTL